MEIWKHIVGFEGYTGAADIEVSNLGNVRPVPTIIDCEGYKYVHFCKGGHKEFVGRLVLNAFVGPPQSGQVVVRANSLMGDNTLENLRWGSRAEHGLSVRLHNSRNRVQKPKKSRTPKGPDRKTAVFDAWLEEYKRLENS